MSERVVYGHLFPWVELLFSLVVQSLNNIRKLSAPGGYSGKGSDHGSKRLWRGKGQNQANFGFVVASR